MPRVKMKSGYVRHVADGEHHYPGAGNIYQVTQEEGEHLVGAGVAVWLDPPASKQLTVDEPKEEKKPPRKAVGKNKQLKVE